MPAGSKASAEPAMTLVSSVYLAARAAVAAARHEVGTGAPGDWFDLDTPITTERVRTAIALDPAKMTLPPVNSAAEQ